MSFTTSLTLKKALGAFAFIAYLILQGGSASTCFAEEGNRPLRATDAGAAPKMQYPLLTDSLLWRDKPSPAAFKNGFLADDLATQYHSPRLLQRRTPDGSEVFVQKTELKSDRIFVQLETGTLAADGTPLAAKPPRQGARFSLVSNGTASTTELQTFVLTASGMADDVTTVGAVGKISLLDKLQIGTSFISCNRAKYRDGGADQGGKGDLLGVTAAYDPYQGKLKFLGEMNLSAYDENPGETASTTSDVAYRAGATGESAGYHYSLMFEHGGSQYNDVAQSAIARDQEGYVMGIGKSFGNQALDFKLSRFNNNVSGASTAPTISRYEGGLEYTTKLIDQMTAGLLLKRKLVMSDSDADQNGRSGSQEDIFSGKLKYPIGVWDLELKGSFLKKSDLASDETTLITRTFSFAPKYTIGKFSVAPEVAIKQINYVVDNSQSCEYRGGVEIKGNTLLDLTGDKLEYQAKGTVHVTAGAESKAPTYLARCKLAYLFTAGNKLLSQIAIKGEYDGRRLASRSDSFSLSFAFELAG